ncbi:replication initiator protein A [Selenomonas ruminis]|uniref:replication initiator protein A n=1 Tax=Selenomonas ruminis TaxID=2593411 RepID=UPI0016551B77|nr:replication initiator protein A [Selenomonas sp. mPRGC5]
MRFRAQDIDNEVYYQLPKGLFSYRFYDGLDVKAKVLYAVLKDRMNLSRRNGWVEENGDIFLMFSYGDLATLLGMSKTAICRAFKKLVEYSLIETVPISRNGAQKIYVNRIEPPESMADVHDYEDRLGRAEVEAVEDEAKNMVADAHTAGITMTLTEAREKVVSTLKETRSVSGTPCSVLETARSAGETPRSENGTPCSVYETAPVPPAELNKTDLYNKTNLERIKKENITTTTTTRNNPGDETDELLQQLIQKYRDNISSNIGPLVKDGLKHLCKTYGFEKVESAITEAALSSKGGVSFKYIQSILERWHKIGERKVIPIKADAPVTNEQTQKFDPEVDLDPNGNPLPEILPGEKTDEFLARLGLI